MKRNQVVVIPVYKPNERLIHLVAELSEKFSAIVVVDDGSGVEYKYIFDELVCNDTVRLCCHAVNLGKGRALKTAFNYVLCEDIGLSGVITVDADGQHLIEDIITVAEAMDNNEKRIILGCRTFGDKTIPFRSRFGNGVSRVAYRYICGVNVSDTQTGLRGIPYVMLGEMCKMSGERYEYETNMLLKAKEMQVPFYEVPITTVYEDNNNSSHFNPIKDSMRIYAILFKYMLSSLASVIIDFTIFSLLTSGGVGVTVATYGGRVVAAIGNFLINKNFVFKNNNRILWQLFSYSLLLLASGTISALLVSSISGATGVSVLVVKMIVEFILFFINYLVQSRVVYK